MVLVTCDLIWFLLTDFGQAFIATGDNPQMAKSRGISPQQMTVAGLMISNGLVGLCGAVVAQSNGYADVNMGMGTIVIALASIIISEVVFRNLGSGQPVIRGQPGQHYLPPALIGSSPGGPVFKQLEFDFFTSSGRLHDATAS